MYKQADSFGGFLSFFGLVSPSELAHADADAAAPESSHNSRNKKFRDKARDRELLLVDKLTAARGQVASLAEELGMIRDSHAIVLDTKESVLRSLIKQNAALSKEVSTPTVVCRCSYMSIYVCMFLSWNPPSVFRTIIIASWHHHHHHHHHHHLLVAR
jgi:hypothetical protein